jgi:hypothetical protein
MPKVPLQIDNTGNVIAPDFCPYKVPQYEYGVINAPCLQPTGKFVVRPGVCCVCKKCEFIPDVDVVEASLPTQVEREKFQEYLAHTNLKTSTSLSGQHQYLMKQDRLPIAIFISRTLYDEMVKSVIEDEKRRRSLLGYFLTEESYICLCHVLGCPVYLSKKLTKSNIQVVGEIEWK